MAIRQAFFDLNGTLFDPSVLAEPLDEGFDALPAQILADAVLLAMAETVTGGYRDFGELMSDAAKRQLALLGVEDRLEEVMGAARRMRPFPEARSAVERLRSAGVAAGVLTNSAAKTARSLIAGSGLELGPIVGTDEVRAFKPHPRVYRHAVEVVGAAPEEVVLITAHGWDALGAKRAGLKAAWLSRTERVPMLGGEAPDFETADLRDAANQIATRA